MGALALTDLLDDRKSRSTREVIDGHLGLRKCGEIEEDLARNFSDDVILLPPGRVRRDHDAVRKTAEALQRAVGDPGSYTYDSLACEGEVALLEWSARTEEMTIQDGVDTFVVRHGLICAQTIRYSVVFREVDQALSIDW